MPELVQEVRMALGSQHSLKHLVSVWAEARETSCMEPEQCHTCSMQEQGQLRGSGTFSLDTKMLPLMHNIL